MTDPHEGMASEWINELDVIFWEHYFKTPEEMGERFRNCPEALRRTLEIAERCDVRISREEVRIPMVSGDTGESSQVMLRRICSEGLESLLDPGAQGADATSRLRHELSVIEQLGWEDYFLFLWDGRRLVCCGDDPVDFCQMVV